MAAPAKQFVNLLAYGQDRWLLIPQNLVGLAADCLSTSTPNSFVTINTSTPAGAGYVLVTTSATEMQYQLLSSLVSLADAVIINPASSTRNVIQPTGNYVPLSLKKYAVGHSSNLLELQNHTGGVMSEFRSDGALYVYTATGNRISSVCSDGNSAFIGQNTGGGTAFYGLAASGTAGFFTRSSTGASSPILVTRNSNGSTSDQQEWRDGLNVAVASVNYLGGAVFNEQGADTDFRIESDTDQNNFFSDGGQNRIGIGTGTPDTKLQVVGDLRTGEDTTNYTNFDATGHQTMHGTAKPWDDLRIEPNVRGTGANNPSFEKYYDDLAGSSRGVYLYSFDDAAAGSEKEIFFTMQMPHSWDGGGIDMHVHWVGAVNDTTASPRWGLEYVWKDIGEVFGDTVTVYTDGTNLVPGGTDADVTAGRHYIASFGTLTPGSTADGISSILIGRLFRNSSDAADTYNAAGAKCGLLYIDAHFQLSSIGSNDEYVK